jgi:hypothetical protein
MESLYLRKLHSFISLSIIIMSYYSCAPPVTLNTNIESNAINFTIDLATVARTCEGSKDHLSCPAWLTLYEELSKHLVEVEVGYSITYQKTQYWIQHILKSLSQPEHNQKMVAYHLLYNCLEKIEFRMIPQIEHVFPKLETLLAQEQDPLWSIRYLKLLGRFLPIGKAELIKSYTQNHHQIDVRSAAWQILTQRHALEDMLNAKEISKAANQDTNTTLLSSLIRAASYLKMKEVSQWCDRDWWQGELFSACKESLVRLNHSKSFYLLKRWIQTFLIEGEQTLQYDQYLAEKLSLLTGFTVNKSLRKSYIKLLDQFFKKRRNEKSALYLSNYFLKIKPKEFALKIILRYYQHNENKLVIQSHIVMAHLKSLIHRLNHNKNL